MPERVGFIGLGAMGASMATRLLRAGYPMSVYARRPEAAQPLVALGARAFASPQDVACNADVVFTMVTATADVEEVILGSHGIIHGATPGSLVIDTSTISPLASRRIASALAARG